MSCQGSEQRTCHDYHDPQPRGTTIDDYHDIMTLQIEFKHDQRPTYKKKVITILMSRLKRAVLKQALDSWAYPADRMREEIAQ